MLNFFSFFKGKIVHKNWTEIYMKMQEVAGFPDPGKFFKVKLNSC